MVAWFVLVWAIAPLGVDALTSGKTSQAKFGNVLKYFPNDQKYFPKFGNTLKYFPNDQKPFPKFDKPFNRPKKDIAANFKRIGQIPCGTAKSSRVRSK